MSDAGNSNNNTNKELIAIDNHLKEIQINGPPGLAKFASLQDAIDHATGLVHPQVRSSLEKLNTKFSKINLLVVDGLSKATANLTRFVLLAYPIMKHPTHGGIPDNIKTIITKVTTLNKSYLDELDKFVTDSEAPLLDVHNALILEASGNRLEKLIELKKLQEKIVIDASNELTKAINKKGDAEGQVQAYQFDLRMAQTAIQNISDYKNQLNAELQREKGRRPQYEQEIQNHRNSSHTEYGRFWIFSWKVRDVHQDNGEGIARENLNRLNARIAQLEQQLAETNTSKAEDRTKHAAAEIQKANANVVAITDEIRVCQDKLREAENNHNATIQEMEKILNSSSRSLDAIKEVDAIALAVSAARQSLIHGYGTITENLILVSDADDFELPILLKAGVMSAITIIDLADKYKRNTSGIDKLKTLLLT